MKWRVEKYHKQAGWIRLADFYNFTRATDFADQASELHKIRTRIRAIEV